MAYVVRDQIADYQRQMIRRVEHARRRAHEILRADERTVWEYDADGLGVRVGTDAAVAEHVLRQIQKVAFSTFDLPGFTVDQNGVCWTHFRIC